MTVMARDTRTNSHHLVPLMPVLLGLLLGAGLARAEDQGGTLQPQKGRFLIATPQLHGTSFEKTVILLTQYSPHGAVGLAINRPTRMLLKEAVPSLQLSQANTRLKAFLGGPVQTDLVFVLMRISEPEDKLVRVFDQVFLGMGLDLLETTVSEDPDPSRPARSYFGYAGWAPGQLDAEIARGDWAIGDGDADYIFNLETDEVWGRLIARWSGHWI